MKIKTADALRASAGTGGKPVYVQKRAAPRAIIPHAMGSRLLIMPIIRFFPVDTPMADSFPGGAVFDMLQHTTVCEKVLIPKAEYRV